MNSVLFRAAILLSTAVGCSAFAAYPERPVKIVHAYPGAPLDAALRFVAEKLSATWNQPVIVDPKPGASEIIAGNSVAKSPADGYTLLVSSDANFSLNQYLFTKLPYDPDKDLVPVTQLFEVPLSFVSSAEVPATNLKEFAEVAKNGKLQYGSAGIGTFNHLAMETLQRALGTSMQQIPYKPGGQLVQDLSAGRIAAAITGIQGAAALAGTGRVRVMAVSGATRQKSAPDVPTFAEAGYPNINLSTYFGIAVPRGTPSVVVEKIATDVRAILMSDEYSQKVGDRFGYVPVGSSPTQFRDVLVKKRMDAQTLIRSLDLKLD